MIKQNKNVGQRNLITLDKIIKLTEREIIKLNLDIKELVLMNFYGQNLKTNALFIY